MTSLKHICKQAFVKPNNKHFFLKRNIASTTLNENYSNKYDIIIAGGGIVGCSLACTLGKNNKLSNKRILLIESSKNTPFTLPEKYSNRVVSLNPGTKKLLTDIDAWRHIESARFGIVKRLQVTDALSDASICFGEETSSENVSYIIENNLLIYAVKKELERLKNVEVLYEEKIKEYHLPDAAESHVNLHLENGGQYSCDLLIGCDGLNSRVREAMGVQYLNWNYNNVGIVATLKFSEEINNCIAWQRFLPTGPLALLPLTSSMSSLVWATTKEHAQQLLGMSNEQFVDALNEALWKVYERSNIIDRTLKAFDTLLRASNIPADLHRRYPPKIDSIDGRARFPLGFGHATNYIGKGVALVGDAAHRIHPLAGQGVNLGFGDISCLNKVLSDAIYAGSSLGNVSFLRDYESERQKYNVGMMAVVEGMYRLYRTDFTPIVLLRSLGLQATDVFYPIKKMMVNQASL